MAPRLQKRFQTEIVDRFVKEHGLKNRMHVPFVEKVVVSMGIKEATTDVKILDQAALELAAITGQKPLVTKAKKSIAGFHLRQDQPVGLKITLRPPRMYEFLDRLFNVAMPKIRDFRGYSESGFDDSGNYTLGIQEQLIFPEINFDEVKRIQGMNITFVTTTRDKKMARALLEYLGLPFRKDSTPSKSNK